MLFKIALPEANNTLDREDFPSENLNALTTSIKEMKNAGAGDALVQAVLSDTGYDLDNIREEYSDEFQPEDIAPELDQPQPPDDLEGDVNSDDESRGLEADES